MKAHTMGTEIVIGDFRGDLIVLTLALALYRVGPLRVNLFLWFLGILE